MDESHDTEGIRIGGTIINNIRFPDDTVLMADTKEKFQRLMDGLNEVRQRNGLKINIEKTEMMEVTSSSESLRVSISLGGIIYRKVNSFKYLGSQVDEDARSQSDIRARIVMANATYGQLRNILTNSSMCKITKVRVLKPYVWLMLLFGCEAWRISKEMRRKLETTEL